MATLQKGDSAPDFDLPSTDGRQRLADHRGRWLVLYFYPRDHTPGCTTEACDFRDRLPGLDADVVGVSPDPVDSHLDFQQAYGLPFPLASDEDHAVAEAYGAWGEKSRYGKTVTGILRSTFVIDPDGKVAEAMVNVRAKGHADRVAERLAELRG